MTTTVAYIVGSGRSGSTLLDLLLGRLDGWFSMGEFRHFWHAQRDEYLCGCGELVARCPVWSDVLVRSRSPEPEAVLADVRRALRLRHVAGLADRRLLDPRSAAAAGRLRETLASVYAATSAVSGASVLVDSSKDPLYGLLLDQIPALRVHAIHLVRDCRAVAWSEQRTRARPELGERVAHLPVHSARQTSLEWDLRNALARVVGMRSLTYTRVSYEELVADPDAIIDRIARAVTGSGAHSRAGAIPSPNHTVGGNPMRFDPGGLTIRPDVEWRTELSPHDRRVVNALAWPLLRRYGYL